MGNEQDGFESEKPVHQVTLNSFYISQYPITVKQYRFFCDKTRKKMPEKPSWGWLDDHPIINVSWNDAKEYCEWKKGRLPTEAEWEFAARGGNESREYEYSGGNKANKVAWYADNTLSTKTYIVGSKAPNELNLFDMSGNVWEWCMDWYNNYHADPQTNPKNSLKGNERIQRGGSWRTGRYPLRVTMRSSDNPDSKYNDVGFRLLKELTSKEKTILELEEEHNLLNENILKLKQPITELEEKLKLSN